MAGVDINFHATPDEISAWLREWMQQEHFHLVALKLNPLVAKEVSPLEIPVVIVDKAFDRLSLILSPPDLTLKYQGDFDDKHFDQLTLYVGRLSEDGLGESWIAGDTDNADAMRVWRKIAKDLKKKTNAGVTAINRQTGASGFYRSHRYSDGAKALESQGVPMIPFQGPKGPLLRLGESLAR
jgi:hypothetical protein